MSGVGSTSGSPDYLLQFPDARVATENTMQCGPEVRSASRTSRRMRASPAPGTGVSLEM